MCTADESDSMDQALTAFLSCSMKDFMAFVGVILVGVAMPMVRMSFGSAEIKTTLSGHSDSYIRETKVTPPL